eukprot:TRINITY_DN232_c1_g1_i1.p2 TRINITY_DN232_c1_g1~~TRINITY_DN232_c1_g1_i1.p2  ORF type:complete len:103 (+),score=0.03 TRINITY_DN232_c1_g1_i1:1-309(+)
MFYFAGSIVLLLQGVLLYIETINPMVQASALALDGVANLVEHMQHMFVFSCCSHHALRSRLSVSEGRCQFDALSSSQGQLYRPMLSLLAYAYQSFLRVSIFA